MEVVRKNVRFSAENWPYIGNGDEIRPMLLFITDRKSALHIDFPMT